MHIIATPRGDESRTLQVSEAFLNTFKEKHPDWKIDELNLAKEEIPPLTMKQVNGKYILLAGKDLFGDFKETWDEIIKHIQRFLSANIYVISTPMWNFNIPYMLKHYIDVIVQPKYLFRYTEGGSVEGLAKNKKMIVISSSGGQYTTQDTKSFDLLEPYLRTIFGYVGITDIQFIKAQPMDMGEELQKPKIEEAKTAAKLLAEKL